MADYGFTVLFEGRNFLRLLEGLMVTLGVSLLSVALSVPLGIALGAVMTSKNRLVRAVTRVYLEFIRLMPQLVLLFVVYFGFTRSFGWNLTAFSSAIIVFTLWGTAEMGDLVRGSIEAVPRHQYDSGRALGLTERQIFRFVIIPQTFRRLIPLSMNLITKMIKTTSLVVFVNVIEVIKVGQQIIEANRMKNPTAAIAVYFTIFMMYFFVCWILSVLARQIEKRQRI